MGWLFIENHATKSAGACDRYARDILRDPFYMRFERNFFWLWVNLIQAGLFYLAGCAIGWATTGSLAAAVAIWRERSGLGRVRPHRGRLAHHLEREFADAPVGLPDLRGRARIAATTGSSP